MFLQLYSGMMRSLRLSNWYTNANRMSGEPSHLHFKAIHAAAPALQISMGDIVAAQQALDRVIALTNALHGHTPQSFALTNTVTASYLHGHNHAVLEGDLEAGLEVALEGPQNTVVIPTHPSDYLLQSIADVLGVLRRRGRGEGGGGGGIRGEDGLHVRRYLEAAMIALFPYTGAARGASLPPLSSALSVDHHGVDGGDGVTYAGYHSGGDGDGDRAHLYGDRAHPYPTHSSAPPDVFNDNVSWSTLDNSMEAFLHGNLTTFISQYHHHHSHATTEPMTPQPSLARLVRSLTVFDPAHWLNTIGRQSLLFPSTTSYPYPVNRRIQRLFGDVHGDGLYLTTPRKITNVYPSLVPPSTPSSPSSRTQTSPRTSPSTTTTTRRQYSVPRPVMTNPTTCPNPTRLHATSFYYTQLGYSWRSFPSLIDVPVRDEYGF